MEKNRVVVESIYHHDQWWSYMWFEVGGFRLVGLTDDYQSPQKIKIQNPYHHGKSRKSSF